MNIDEQIEFVEYKINWYKNYPEIDVEIYKAILKTLIEVKEWEITREYVSSAISQRSSIKKPGNQGG